MSNGNPFDTSGQVSNIMPGVQMMGGALQRRGEFERERVAKEQNKQLREKAANVFQSGDASMMAEFIIKNPGAKGIFDEAFGAKKESMIGEAKQWLVDNADPVELGSNKLNDMYKAGAGDREISEEFENVKALVTNQDEEKKKREMVLAIYDNKAFKAYQAQQGISDDTTKDISTADMKNYNMAKAEGYTGSFVEYQALNKSKEKKSTPDILNFGQAVEGGYKGSFMDFLGEKSGKPKEKEDFTKNLTPKERDKLARLYNVTRKLPITGRSDEVKALNVDIIKRALALQDIKGVDEIDNYYASLDTEGRTKDINAQQKKLGSMRSFALNIDKQAEKINTTLDKIFKLDAKILNYPINKIMTDYVGSADRATLAVFVGELSEEIGKLASGATDSVAALSEGGREKWDRIFSLNLPTSALKGLVAESKELGEMRVDSMKESLAESKRIRRGKKTARKKLKYNFATGKVE